LVWGRTAEERGERGTKRDQKIEKKAPNMNLFQSRVDIQLVRRLLVLFYGIKVD
jgi:hypothetical protein